MRGEAMSRICEKLPTLGVDLSQVNALEFFAREGSWQTVRYANLVKHVTAWEILPMFEESLRKNLPNATIEIGDSFALAKEKGNAGKFDMIVFDNPQGIFGDNHCEHFDALPFCGRLMSPKRGIVIVNVNHNPFNYDLEANATWRELRSRYYGLIETSDIDKTFLLSFYADKFGDMGFKVDWAFIEPRTPHISYYVFGLRCCVA